MCSTPARRAVCPPPPALWFVILAFVSLCCDNCSMPKRIQRTRSPNQCVAYPFYYIPVRSRSTHSLTHVIGYLRYLLHEFFSRLLDAVGAKSRASSFFSPAPICNTILRIRTDVHAVTSTNQSRYRCLFCLLCQNTIDFIRQSRLQRYTTTFSFPVPFFCGACRHPRRKKQRKGTKANRLPI